MQDLQYSSLPIYFASNTNDAVKLVTQVEKNAVGMVTRGYTWMAMIALASFTRHCLLHFILPLLICGYYHRHVIWPLEQVDTALLLQSLERQTASSTTKRTCSLVMKLNTALASSRTSRPFAVRCAASCDDAFHVIIGMEI